MERAPTSDLEQASLELRRRGKLQALTLELRGLDGQLADLRAELESLKLGMPSQDKTCEEPTGSTSISVKEYRQKLASTQAATASLAGLELRETSLRRAMLQALRQQLVILAQLRVLEEEGHVLSSQKLRTELRAAAAEEDREAEEQGIERFVRLKEV